MRFFPRQNVVSFALEHMNRRDSRWYLWKKNLTSNPIVHVYRRKNQMSEMILQEEDIFYLEFYRDSDQVNVWSGKGKQFNGGRDNFAIEILYDIGQFVAFEQNPINFDYYYPKHHRWSYMYHDWYNQLTQNEKYHFGLNHDYPHPSNYFLLGKRGRV